MLDSLLAGLRQLGSPFRGFVGSAPGFIEAHKLLQ